MTGIGAEPEGVSWVGRVAVIREIEPRRYSGVDRQIGKVRQVERCKTLSPVREIPVREPPGTVGVRRIIDFVDQDDIRLNAAENLSRLAKLRVCTMPASYIDRVDLGA